MKAPNRLLAEQGTTIFTVMSALAERHGAINLGQGFPDTDGPGAVVAAAAAALGDTALGETRNQYAPMTGLPVLREAVAAANRRFWGITVDPATEVVVTSGATEALAASLMALLDPGDEVVLLEPLYDTYLPMVRLLGAVPRLVRLTPPDWRLDPAALAAAFGPRTKLLLLNTPMNPTGKVFTAEELAIIADLLHHHDAYAVCDEVYEHLVFPGARHLALMSLPGMRERCLRIGSAGKTFSLTGWKIGYVSAPAPLAAVVARAHQNLVFASAPHLQRAVAFGLGLEDGYFAALGATLAAKCARLSRGLEAAGFSVLAPRGGYFVVADAARLAGGEGDAAFCRRLTAEAGVAAIPVSAFQDGGPAGSLVRFAFCKRDAVLDEACARLRRYFARAGGIDAARASA
ncbi:MAG: aminotransferase [Acetobacteraceae bacterium]